MLTRLSDRYEEAANGKVRVKRYGKWGSRYEIEVRGRKFFVVDNQKILARFKTLQEAELFLADTK